MIAQIIVRNKSKTRGSLSVGSIAFPCALGRGGIVASKYEGDGATPTGILPFRRIYYRPDRIPRPQTKLECRALKPDFGWCDDPSSSLYNQLISLPFLKSHEKLWREDHLYDVLIELGYNDCPPIPHHGSAIFLHLCKENCEPTQGCIAIRRNDMIRFLTLIRPGDALRVRR